jgi:hypothetical protein
VLLLLEQFKWNQRCYSKRKSLQVRSIVLRDCESTMNKSRGMRILANVFCQ